MRYAASTLVAVAAAVLVGCGGGGYGYDSGDSYGGGGFGFGEACIEVANDASNGTHHITSVQFGDPLTGVVLGSRAVDVAPGEELDLMDLPEGDYLVSAVFDDGTSEIARLADPDPADVAGFVHVSMAVEQDVVF